MGQTPIQCRTQVVKIIHNLIWIVKITLNLILSKIVRTKTQSINMMGLTIMEQIRNMIVWIIKLVKIKNKNLLK